MKATRSSSRAIDLFEDPDDDSDGNASSSSNSNSDSRGSVEIRDSDFDDSSASAEELADTESDEESSDEVIKKPAKKQPKKAASSAKAPQFRQNLSVKDILAADDKRIQFLIPYRNVLKPFVSSKVLNLLTSAMSAMKHGKDGKGGQHVVNITKQPKSLRNCTMRDYQLDGLSWMVNNYNNGLNCILGDEMGLGKTLQTISFLSYLVLAGKAARSTHSQGPFLVVVPLTVMFNWSNELRRFAPSLQVLRVHTTDVTESNRLRTILACETSKLEVILTTYEMLKSSYMGSALRRIVYRAVVLDEGHRIKNDATEVSKACYALKGIWKLVLTGTPLQNNLRETGVLLAFLAPNIFTDMTLFEDAFDLSKFKGRKKGNGSMVDRDLLTAAHYMMRPFILRRLKSEVESKLPPKLETLVECPLSPLQKEVTRFLLMKQAKVLKMMDERLRGVESDDKDDAKGADGNGTAGGGNEGEGRVPQIEDTSSSAATADGMEVDPAAPADVSVVAKKRSRPRNSEEKKLATSSSETASLLGLMAHLRKAGNHPYLFPGIEPPTLSGTANEDIVTSSGKMMVLDKLIKALMSAGHRLVIFSQYTRTLDILSDYLDMRGWAHRRLDGGTNRVMREVNVSLFNSNMDLPIFLLSTRAGGEGVNLYTADTVILFDSDWNPQVDIQAMARVHRIGQTKVVHVYRLVSRGSVDEVVVHRAQRKLFLDSMVNRGSTAQGKAMDAPEVAEDEEEAVVGDAPEEAQASTTAEVSAVFTALKFGWNAAFRTSEGKAQDEVLSDAQVSALIDRSRGLGTAEEAPAAETVAVTADTPSGVLENQEMCVSSFDEHAPLIGIDTLTDQLECTTEEVQAAAPKQEEMPSKRRRVARMTDIMVEGVGMVSILKPVAAPVHSGPSHERNPLAGFHRTNTTSSAVQYIAPTGGKQVAGRDFTHQDICQACWDGGDLILCDHCPCSYHMRCLSLPSIPNRFSCPHHNCCSCQRTSSAAGLLFRCDVCEAAYCEDCLPSDAKVLGESPRLKGLGYHLPSSACYVRCSLQCREFDEVAALEEDAASVTSLDVTAAAAGAEEGNNEQSNPLGLPEHHPLHFCVLEDLPHRLGRDEEKVQARFKHLGEIPNLAVRLHKIHPSVLWGLFDILRNITRSVRSKEDTHETSPSKTDAPPSVSEAIATILAFQGVPASTPIAEKVSIFLSAVRLLAPYPIRTVNHLSALLGICTVTALRAGGSKEPKFCFTSNYRRRSLEEAIVALLCVLSPRNLILPKDSSKSKGSSSASDDVRIDGLLYTSRLLQTLGEAVRDENSYFYAAMALKDEGISCLSAWHVYYPLGGPSNEEKRLSWLVPAARMFYTLTVKDVLQDVPTESRLMKDLKKAFQMERGVYKPKAPYVPPAPAPAPAPVFVPAPMPTAPGAAVYDLVISGAGSAPLMVPPMSQGMAQLVPNRTMGAFGAYQPMAGNPLPARAPARVVDLTADTSKPSLPAPLPMPAIPRNGAGNVVSKKKPSLPSGAISSHIFEISTIRRNIEATVMAQYTTAHETQFMMAWLIDHQAALDRYQLSSATPAPASSVGSWRASLSPDVRQETISTLHKFLTLRGIRSVIKSEDDYMNKLRVFEIALLTLATSEEEYASKKWVATRTPVMVKEFENYVKERLRKHVDLELAKHLKANEEKTRVAAAALMQPFEVVEACKQEKRLLEQMQVTEQVQIPEQVKEREVIVIDGDGSSSEEGQKQQQQGPSGESK